MDTQYTLRAQELRDLYNSLQMTYLTKDERLDALLSLKHTVKVIFAVVNFCKNDAGQDSPSFLIVIFYFRKRHWSRQFIKLIKSWRYVYWFLIFKNIPLKCCPKFKWDNINDSRTYVRHTCSSCKTFVLINALDM